jgi:hypothetical protein
MSCTKLKFGGKLVNLYLLSIEAAHHSPRPVRDEKMCAENYQ